MLKVAATRRRSRRGSAPVSHSPLSPVIRGEGLRGDKDDEPAGFRQTPHPRPLSSEYRREGSSALLLAERSESTPSPFDAQHQTVQTAADTEKADAVARTQKLAFLGQRRRQR